MVKKYTLTENKQIVEVGGKKIELRRIKSLINFDTVSVGDLGGWVESEENLSHEGNAWIYDEAFACLGSKVSGNSKLYDTASVADGAEVVDSFLFGKAVVKNSLINKSVLDDSEVYDSKIERSGLSGNLIIGSSEVVDSDITGGLMNNCSVENVCFRLEGTSLVNGELRKNNDICRMIGFLDRDICLYQSNDGNPKIIVEGFYGEVGEYEELVGNEVEVGKYMQAEVDALFELLWFKVRTWLLEKIDYKKGDKVICKKNPEWGVFEVVEVLPTKGKCARTGVVASQDGINYNWSWHELKKVEEEKIYE